MGIFNTEETLKLVVKRPEKAKFESHLIQWIRGRAEEIAYIEQAVGVR